FTIANIAELYAAQFAQGYSNDQCQAAIWALLRHRAYEDGAYYHTNMQHGLHPAYATFNQMEKPTRKSWVMLGLLRLHLITMQGHLDGRISVLLRCPGFEYLDDIATDGVTIDVYITLHKLLQDEQVSGDTAILLVCASQQGLKLMISHIHSGLSRMRYEQVTGNPKAKMEWQYYFWNIISCYCIVIEGWLTTVPFMNLGSASSSL
ncbi:hypothetical protein EDC04DRAFT_2554274, partial [Pisolithus marmoratus]